MKNTQKTILGCLVAISMASCTITTPVAASDAEMGDKRGTSETTVVFGIELNKNYGVKDAATNGNITSGIATMDLMTKNFILFQKKTLIVTAK